MINRFRCLIPSLFTLLIAIFCCPGALVAQGSPVFLSGGIGFSTTSYNKQITNAQNLSDRGFGFQGTFAPRFYEYFSVLAEIGWEYVGQVCLDNSCDSEKTSTSSRYTSLGAGFVSPPVDLTDGSDTIGLGITGYAGYQWVNAGLSEDNCINCTIDDLDINGGYYVEGSLDIYPGSEVALGFAYRRYGADADLNSRFTLRAVYTGD